MPKASSSGRRRQQDFNPFGSPILKVISYALMIGIPAGAIALEIYLLVDAFQEGLNQGLRSFAAVILPLLVATYLVFERDDVLDELEEIAGIKLAVASFVATTLCLVALTYFLTGGPFAELAISCGLAVTWLAGKASGKEAMTQLMYGVAFSLTLFMLAFGAAR